MPVQPKVGYMGFFIDFHNFVTAFLTFCIIFLGFGKTFVLYIDKFEVFSYNMKCKRQAKASLTT